MKLSDLTYMELKLSEWFNTSDSTTLDFPILPIWN